MQQSQTRIKTALLGLVLLASLMLKSGHHLLLHHDHHTRQVCHSNHENSSAHLHDERYNPDDCSICAFHFGASEPMPTPVLLLKQQAYTQACPLPPATPHLTDTGCSTLLRGPPVWSHSV